MIWKKRERNRDVWQVERKSSSDGDPLMIKIAGREQYFVLRPNYQIRKKWKKKRMYVYTNLPLKYCCYPRFYLLSWLPSCHSTLTFEWPHPNLWLLLQDMSITLTMATGYPSSHQHIQWPSGYVHDFTGRVNFTKCKDELSIFTPQIYFISYISHFGHSKLDSFCIIPSPSASASRWLQKLIFSPNFSQVALS